MGYINRIDNGQEKEMNRMSNEELNSIIIGQTIVLAFMFIIVVVIMTMN